MTDGATALLTEDGNSSSTISSTSITVSEDDENVMVVNFDDAVLYSSHTYKLTIPAGAFALKSNAEVKSEAISLTYKGASAAKRYFGTTSVTPVAGTAESIGTVNVAPNFPKGCGFVYLPTNKKETYTLKLYKGEKAEGEPVGTYSGTLSNDTKSLDFKVNQTIAPNETYTVAMDTASVKAYIVGDAKYSYYTDWTFTGFTATYTSPYGVAITGSSVAEGSELGSVGVVAFYASQDVTAAENASATLYKGDEAVRTAEVFTNGSLAMADFTDTKSHAPYATEQNASYKVMLPAASLTANNAETSVSFTGLKPAEASKPEYVTATLSIGGYAAASTKVAKDSAATLAITPADGWTLATLTLNEADVLADYADGKYTTPKLTADATVAATFSYTGYAYEESSETTGIITAGDTGLKAEIGQGYVKITGVKSGDELKAYTLGGALIATETVSSGNAAKLTLPTGTYIVKVNQTAFKVNVR